MHLLGLLVIVLGGVVGLALCATTLGEGDIEVVGLFDNCGGNSVCDDKSHLACVTSKCSCDEGKGYVLDETGMKCVLASDTWSGEDYVYEGSPEESSEEGDHDHEKDSSWPEDENEWQLPENGTNLQDTTTDDDGGEKASPEEQDPVGEQAKSTDAEGKKSSRDVNEKKKSSDDVVQVQIAKEELNKKEQPLEVGGGVGPNHEDYVDFWGVSEEDAWPLQDEQPTGVQCSQDADCTSLGHFASCNPFKRVCECYDTDDKNRHTLLVNGTCFLEKGLGSECNSHEECDAVIQGPAWCHFNMSSGVNICSCQAFTVWDDKLQECLPIATDGVSSRCHNDLQCSAREALGPFSRCSQFTGLCECAVGVLQYDYKCVEVRGLGDECETDQECEASLGLSALCNPESNTCACRPGHFCLHMPLRPSMSGFTMLVLLALASSVLVSSVVCLIARRRGHGKSYVFIRQQNDV